MNKTNPWAASIDVHEVAHVGSLRLVPRIDVCVADNELWLRGPALDDELTLRLRLLPGARRFAVLDDGQLQAVGTLVPKGHLPAGPWQPLAKWLQVELPSATWPGAKPSPVGIRLVRTNEPGEPTLLLTTLVEWSTYALTAPVVRLERLTFAVDASRRVLVRGTPLPPLPGERWVERDGIATPAGWTWSPGVEAAVLREMLGLETNDLALLNSDGSWELIAASDLVRATRSAVRASEQDVTK